MRTLTVDGLVLQFDGNPAPTVGPNEEALEMVCAINQILQNHANETGGAQLIYYTDEAHVEVEERDL